MSGVVSGRSGVGGPLFPPAPMSRQQEKAELQVLNDRYSNYVSKVQKMREDASKVDSSTLLKSIRTLEEELEAIKAMYEREMNHLRKELDFMTGEKKRFEMISNKTGQLASDLQDRLTIEGQRTRALQEQAGELQRLYAQKDLELQQSHVDCEEVSRQLIQYKRDYDDAEKTILHLRKKFEEEQLRRCEIEDTVTGQKKKLEFTKQIHAQEAAELKSRLEDKANQILHLESKVRELSKSDTTLHEMLARVREAATAELRRYQEESESAYNQNLQELKVQMDQDAGNIAKMSEENKTLLGEIQDMEEEMLTLKNKLRMTEQTNGNLADNLDQERNRSTAHIRGLENKLHELQNLLVTKLREMGSGKEPPIRVEIETLKTILDEEENKLHHSAISGLIKAGSDPAAMQGSGGVGSMPPIATGNRGGGLTGGSVSLPSVGFKSSRGRALLTEGREGQPGVPFANTTGLSTSLTTARELYPLRPSTAPKPEGLGQGKDYFDSMFSELKREAVYSPRLHPKSSPPATQRTPWTTTTHDYTTATSSSVGPLKILEVSEDGTYIRLHNTSPNKDLELGGYMLQQNVAGHPAAVYRFLPRTTFRAGTTVTVWSAASHGQNSPPTDFLWKEQHKWGTGPECTTILCKPTGQAIAWTTAAHRFSKKSQVFEPSQSDAASTRMMTEEEDSDIDINPEVYVEVDGKPVTALKREDDELPPLAAAKHPHGQYFGQSTHPYTTQPRVKTLGNDNSSKCRQARTQNSQPVPDPLAGELYAGSGAGASRTGAAPLRRPSPDSKRSSATSKRATHNPKRGAE